MLWTSDWIPVQGSSTLAVFGKNYTQVYCTTGETNEILLWIMSLSANIYLNSWRKNVERMLKTCCSMTAVRVIYTFCVVPSINVWCVYWEQIVMKFFYNYPFNNMTHWTWWELCPELFSSYVIFFNKVNLNIYSQQ